MTCTNIVSIVLSTINLRLFIFLAITSYCGSLCAQIVHPAGYDHDLATAATTSLYFFSEPGDFIGGGREWYSDLSSSSFNVTGNGTTFANFSGGGWGGRFESEAGRLLEPGFYDLATRFPFNASSEPGLSVTGMGRGCNRSGSRFEIFELTYGGTEVTSFDVEFAQYCENESATGTSALFGRLRFNAVPEPNSILLFAVAMLLSAPSILRKNRNRR